MVFINQKKSDLHSRPWFSAQIMVYIKW